MSDYKTKKGFIEIICGSMFSGKSEELIRRLKRAELAKQRILVFKHSLDDRSIIEYVVSHNGSKIKAIPIDDPQAILELMTKDINVIGIDEVQFFPSDIVDVIIKLVEAGKRVVASGLDLDFRGVPFGPIPTLMAISDSVTKLKAICMNCGKDAHFSQRLVNGRAAQYHDPIIMVGAEEKYQARCRNCHEIDQITQFTTSKKSYEQTTA